MTRLYFYTNAESKLDCKVYKSKINEYMKDQKINLIEDLLIKFVSEKNLS